jgi:hypothetical protein
MASIKIAFFSWDTFYGRVIQMATKSKFSHCGIITEDISDKVVVYEALNKGLVRSEYSKSLFENWKIDGTVEVIEVVVNSETENIEEVCKKYLGTGYDWYSIFFIALAIIFRKDSIKYSNGSKLLICSEFVCRASYDWSKKVFNLSDKLGKTYDMITPQNIYAELTKDRK